VDEVQRSQDVSKRINLSKVDNNNELSQLQNHMNVMPFAIESNRSTFIRWMASVYAAHIIVITANLLFTWLVLSPLPMAWLSVRLRQTPSGIKSQPFPIYSICWISKVALSPLTPWAGNIK
jgi:hypothetical protein